MNPDPVEVLPYSTNNAWGFGGSVGTEYTFENGWILRAGIACFRHLPGSRIIYAQSPEGRRYLDLHVKKELTNPDLPAEIVQFIRDGKAKNTNR